MKWDEGTEVPSLRSQILELVREDPDRPWILSEFRGEVYPDLEFPHALDSMEQMGEAMEITRVTAAIEATVEQLVDEGHVEKREFRLDTISMITVNEKEYEEVMSQLPDDADTMTTQTFYKAADA